MNSTTTLVSNGVTPAVADAVGSISSVQADAAWWRSAVIYQVYIRSFADGNGDGLGDIAGLRSKLDHLVDLGIDAIWINPWYPSPMADAGYDVITYLDVEPRFGTMAEAEALILEAHQRGIRVLLDIVPNHSSSQHEWFQQALVADPGSELRDRFIFREGRGADGSIEPNDWPSCFGGPAWTRVNDSHGMPGQWYLHLFDPAQPDRNWEHPAVRAEFEDTLRFWFDRGVDGFRIDVAHSLFKEPGLPDVDGRKWGPHTTAGLDYLEHPFWDRDELHDVYRSWRRIADSYDPPRVFVAEAWVPYPSRLARYVRPDELHTSFNFDFLRAPWIADELRSTIDITLREHLVVNAPPTWVLSNHDTVRHVSRYARVIPKAAASLAELVGDVDLELGHRRARAATMLMLALPGCAYIYQGEELGLAEVEDLPESALQDPTWWRTGHTERGRDGCRVPIPWSGSESPFGFSETGATEPWLPQPSWFADHAASSLRDDHDSILAMYQQALAVRRSNPALGDGTLRWLDMSAGVLAFERDPGFVCITNVSSEPVVVPTEMAVLMSSGSLDSAGRIAADTTVWLQRR